MTTASQTTVARIVGRQTERRGFVVLAVGALVLVTSLAAQMVLANPSIDRAERAQ